MRTRFVCEGSAIVPTVIGNLLIWAAKDNVKIQDVVNWPAKLSSLGDLFSWRQMNNSALIYQRELQNHDLPLTK